MGRPALHAAASVVLLVVLAVPAGLLAAHAAGSAVGAVLAAVIVAGGFVPLQAWAGRLLDRLLFGGRAGPYATLARLGHSLGQAPAAETVLPLLVDTIASCLHLPYVAVQLAGENTPAASIGQAFGPIESLPLVHGGRQVGTLQIGVPAGRRVLDARDAGLLRDVAAQAGPAVGAVSLNRQLARSRERLARTSEEERQRIRRNLHDGLGPTLAGVALGIEASHRAALRAGVDVGLEGIHRDVLAGLDDLKRLLAQLRPASLDELGLAGSLREHAAALAAVGTMALEVRGSSNAGLPVALEVAAYFIGREAMNNAVRHSGGSLCTVSLAVGNALDLQISDDGCGPDDSWVPGVGLGSMAERARELGGECAVEPNPGGGTRVRVWIPVPL
nr:ATP-binding protein [Paeniglutamicibacter psychrophenolicus]